MSTFDQRGQKVGTQINSDDYWKKLCTSLREENDALKQDNACLKEAIAQLMQALELALGMPQDEEIAS